jgi:hypothetical protein
MEEKIRTEEIILQHLGEPRRFLSFPLVYLPPLGQKKC